MAVLSISSQVAMGHVGNSASAFALRRLGHEVWDVPTVVLSHHPGHGAPAGLTLAPEQVAAMVAAIVGRARPEAVFAGYLADPANAATVARTVERLREAGPLSFFLDPILGDSDTGVYVRDGVVEAVRNELLPLADMVFPNRFELGLLAGRSVDTEAEALDAARLLLGRGPKAVICTSAPMAAGASGALAVTADAAYRISLPLIPDAPHGTGDLFAGLVAAKRLEGWPVVEATAHAVAAVHAVIAWSRAIASADLALVVGQAAVLDPPTPATVKLVAG